MVKLDDGTLGIIPEEWMKKYGLLAGLGTLEEEHLRFTRPQAGLLDALLAAEPAVDVDAIFERVRQELRDFAGIKAADPTPQFRRRAARLPARRAWAGLYFLQRFGFGGCLADDMGLGQNHPGAGAARIAPRAPFERRRKCQRAPRWSSCRARWSFIGRKRRRALRPSCEFSITPARRGANPGEHFDEYDLVITTYGTCARDALAFQGSAFRLLHSRRSPGDQKRRHACRPRPCACCVPTIAWR